MWVAIGLYAQTTTIKGKVSDENGESVIGATVLVKAEPTRGTVTNLDGEFSIQAKDGELLVISYVGYKSAEMPAKDGMQVNLVPDSELLDEVVVVGFGTQKKANLTGSVTAVDMKKTLGDRPITSTSAALQGAVPGLMISGGSSVGQQGKTINIRGQLSLNESSPLVLIDNVPGSLDMLNPEDIQSVSVLKDAASSAIYGARAANGVILVTTKRPNKGEAFRLNYNNNFGFSNSINRPQQASLKDYFQAYKDAQFSTSYWANGQDIDKWMTLIEQYKADPSSLKTIGDGIYVDPDTGIPYYLHEKDPFALMLETGFRQSHNVSASGGTDKTRYRIAGGFTNENGPLLTNKDTFNRYNISSYVSADMTNWFTQELDVKYISNNKTFPLSTGGMMWTLRNNNYYPEGSLPDELALSGEGAPFLTPKNALLYARSSEQKTHNVRLFSKSTFRPLEGLDVVFEYTFDRKDHNYRHFSGKDKWSSIQLETTEKPKDDILTRRRFYTDYNAINAYMTYSKSFGNHGLSLMAGYNQESNFYEIITNEVYSQVSTTVPGLGNAMGEKKLNEDYSEYSVRGVFFRANYDYLGRYLLEVNGRYDGSSKFTKERRFGFFPSISAGWNIAQEAFMEPYAKEINLLKLRASYGSIGNQDIAPYQFSPTMNVNNNSGIWLKDGKKVVTIGTPGLVSDSFTWETVSTLDVGLDWGFFGNRLTGTFDWYQRDTRDMVTKAGVIELPGVVGAEAPAQNGADLRTRGWELAVNWRDNIGDFGYRVGFNLYDHRTEITKYANENGLLSQWYEGAHLGDKWGLTSDGYYTKEDFEDLKTWKLKEGVPSINGFIPKPGDVKYKNLRDDENSINRIDNGKWTLENPGDYSIIGNETPRFSFGANFGVSYKGLDLSVMLQGIGKRDVWLSGQAYYPFAGSGSSDAVFQPLYYNQTDYWKPKSLDVNSPDYMVPVNPNPKYYRLYGQVENVASNTRVSDRNKVSGAYLRVKNVSLSYVFPRQLLDKISLQGLKLFVSIENLATFTELPKGFDPEQLGWGYPFYRTTSFGTNITF